MAAWTKAEVLLVAPELDVSPAIPDPTFTFWIAVAERQVSADAFGDRIVEAGAYLTAHLMIRSGLGTNGGGSGGAGAAAGAVSGITVGKVSVQFATLAQAAGGVTPEEAEYLTTRAGSAYLAHVRMCVCTPFVLESGLLGPI
jgi:hypothetical protein